MNETAIDTFTAAIEQATIPTAAVFCDDAVLDATVPNWRFTVRGDAAVRAELAGWYAVPGRFEALNRTPLPDGELVEFTRTWDEGGMPHAIHQAHLIHTRDGRIATDVVFCGGKWPASLLAEMEAAQQEADRAG